ncbi:MAG TPA: ABC transporter permease [Vicinamibacterales bacterium]|nr:ABC transporter permease [Vicinamibacterales bacterium]
MDFRYALRSLGKQPQFTFVAVLTLALGIGANAAIFSLVYRALLRPLPYRDAGRLVFIWNSGKDGGRTNVAIPDYLDRRADAPAIEDATLFTPRNATLSAAGRPEQLVALAVTPSFFSTLGRGPALGRAFTADEAVPGANRRVILTDAAWRGRFGGDPGIIGRSIQLDGEPHEIVGVLPADLDLPLRDVALLTPFAFTPGQMSDQARGNEFSFMIARLRPGATIDQLNAQMRAIVSRLIDRLPARAAYMRNSGFTGVAVPLREQLVGEARTPLLLLQGGVLLVLLIACANVASLLLMRATGRGSELAIRSSLGASPWRIVRQLLVEGTVLSALGGAAGLAVAVFAVRGLAAMVADQIPSASGAAVDPAALAFTAAVALLTGVVFGVVPSLTVLRGATATALKEHAGRASPGRRTRTARAALIVAEIAVAVTLVAGAGLLMKSFARVTRVDPGFASERVLSAQLALPRARYRDAAAMRAFWSRLLGELRGIPGVRAAALTGAVPFSGQDGSGTYRIVDRPIAPTDPPPHAFLNTVGGDFFRALEIPLRAGRVFNDGDTASASRVVVIDELLARRHFAGADPIGRQLNFDSPRNYTIVGVVGTINQGDLARPVPEERIYFNVGQVAQSVMGIVVKTSVDPASIAPQLRAAVQTVDPEQAISQVRPLDEWRRRSLQPRRTPTVLLALFGAAALVLSAIGIYGVLSSAVAERRRELAIRQALGAGPGSILTLVLGEGLRTTVAGIALGIGGAALLTRYLQSLLFGVTPRDATVFAASAGVLAAVALLACYVPARRATRVDPIAALRDV